MRNVIATGAFCCLICAAQGPPSREAIKAAVQAQLDSEKPACVVMFDKKDPTGHLLLKSGSGMYSNPRLDAYYSHGLLVRKDVHVSLGDASIIPMTTLLSKRKNAWRYDWAPIVTADVVNDDLCYGYRPRVDDVVRWTEPKRNEITIAYTWHFEKVSDWATQSWLENADPEVWRNATEKQQTAHRALTLFNDGWR